MKQDPTTLPNIIEYSKRLRQLYQDKHVASTFQTSNIPFASMPWIAGTFFVLDLRTGKYLYLSEVCPDDLKISHSILKEEGFSYFLTMIHKNDLPIMTDFIFKKRLEFAQTIPKEEQGNYCYSNNFRMLTDNNSYKQVLQYIIVSQTDDSGMPLVFSGARVDISMYKNDNKIIATVAQLQGAETAKIIYEDYYYPEDEEVELLTTREKEIIQMIAGGHSNEKIAARLNISFHTVKTHRRNIREKTQTTNTAQLIAFAKKNGFV